MKQLKFADRIREMAQEIFNDPGHSPWFSFRFLLKALSTVYGGAMALRAACYRQGIFPSYSMPCKVISVGNITAGGTGKTPMTLYLADLLSRMGYRTAVLSRGYKGKAEKRGGIVSDGENLLMGPEQAGDEPCMMAMRLGVPVLAGRDRVASGMRAVSEFAPDVLVLDDAFQHLRIRRDLNIVLVDARRPFGNFCLIPRGTLREPLSALRRADVCILTRCGRRPPAALESLLRENLPGIPVLKSSHRPKTALVSKGTHTSRLQFLPAEGALTGLRVFAFSGIAQNSNFFDAVRACGANLTGTLGFPDHHAYGDSDFQAIMDAARRAGAQAVATTEKDWARIGNSRSWSLDLAVIGIDIELEDPRGDLVRLIENRLKNSEKAF